MVEPIEANIIDNITSVNSMSSVEVFKSKCGTKSNKKPIKMDIEDPEFEKPSLSNRYMTRLYIEVLKMVALRGYNILPYQAILDDERRNDFLSRQGESANYLSDDIAGDYIYRVTTGILNQNIPNVNRGSRSMFNSIFSRGEEKLIIYFAETEDLKSVSKDSASRFVNNLRSICLNLFGTPDYCNTFVAKMRGILITKNNLTPGNQSWLSQITVIEHFLDTSLLCSISENVFSSRRRILNKEEKTVFAKELGMSLSKIPSVVLSKDISYQFYGIDKDDVVREERESIFPESLIPKSISYRFCKKN